MKRVRVEDVANMLGVTAPIVRVGIQQNLLPFGVAIKQNSRYEYLIFPEKLIECVGKERFDTVMKEVREK